MKHTPSQYQKAIFNFIAKAGSTLSAIIEAVAGSGKTTTIVEALGLLPRSASVVFLAFNKSIVETLVSLVPAYHKVKTFHSLAMSVWLRHAGRRTRVDVQKVQRILWDTLDKKEGAVYGAFVKRLVGLAKNEGIGVLVPDELPEWQRLIEHHVLTLDTEGASEEKAISIARDVLEQSNAKTWVIDFDDMLYLPVLNDLTFERFDYVFVDEYQDTNRIQQAILRKLIKPATGRLIAVGDTHQAIYGFRGADAAAMKRAGDEFNCETLPLSVSYRCARAVVNFAKKYVPHIEASDTAPEGKVETLATYTAQTFQPTDAIICRNNAPLVAMAYAFIKRSIGVKILGRDIGENLVNLVRKMEATGIDTLQEKLEAYRHREVEKNSTRGREAAAAAVQDKVECLNIIIESLGESKRDIAGLIEAIVSLFSDNSGGLLTLCTAHKSKGLEWERVFILDFEKLMPSKWAVQDWQLEQEQNLIYVAATRAKLELYFIDSDAWDDNDLLGTKRVPDEDADLVADV